MHSQARRLRQLHPRFCYFNRPKNRNLKLWRYTDFPKFLSLLQRRALHFARFDKLPDPFEGKDPEIIGAYLKKMAQSPEWASLAFDPIEHQEELRKSNFVNCWHMNTHESAAFWDIYGKNAIAIQTTALRIQRAFAPMPPLLDRVKYLDYDSDKFPRHSNVWTEFFQKRKPFDYEHEARIVFSDRNHLVDPNSRQPKGATITQRHKLRPRFTWSKNGVFFAVNIEELIGAIRVSPKASRWFVARVQNVTHKYGLKRTVTKSSLLDRPNYGIQN